MIAFASVSIEKKIKNNFTVFTNAEWNILYYNI